MLTHIHPSRVRFTFRSSPLIRGRCLPSAESGTAPGTAKCPEPLCPPWALPVAARCLAPRRKALPLLHRSYGLMRQTKILLTDFVFLIRKVFAGCCQPLLEVGPSRRYLCDLCMGAWTRTPPRSIGACVRFFPIDIGLSLGSRRSARETLPQHSFMRGFHFGAAVIHSCSGSHTCLALWLF